MKLTSSRTEFPAWRVIRRTAAPRALFAGLTGWVLCGGVSLRAAGSAAGSGARPVVAAAKVERGELSQQVSFDAELRPYQEVELHARISGYLDSIKVDVGDLVKEDQLIATLDQPESKTEIEHALAAERRSKAEIEHAQAAAEDAHLSFSRVTAVDKAQPNLIAQQDIDAARSKDRSAAAALNAAREQDKVAEADVKKLRIMESYTRITAPFGGVITKRYSDPGALIQAGTSSGSLPLVRLSQTDRLRAVFPVSISYVSGIKVGDPVEIRIASLKQTIRGTVARFTRKVETATRTMEAEVDVPNADLRLLPGLYGSAVLTTERCQNALLVPIEAVAQEKNGESTVFVIGPDGTVEERQVKTGIQTPLRIEIKSGVSQDELVMIGGRAQVRQGQKVEVKLTPPTKAD
jgi:RND family efflux transporter MFP subunit